MTYRGMRALARRFRQLSRERKARMGALRLMAGWIATKVALLGVGLLIVTLWLRLTLPH